MNVSPSLSLSQLIARSASFGPERSALIYQDQPISFAELQDRTRRVAGALKARGIGPGDRVAMWLPTVPAYVVLCLACAQLGAIAVAVNTRYRAGEVEDVLVRSGAKALALWPDFRGVDYESILADISAQAFERVDFVIRLQ